jgi:hypothetical protein
MGCNKKEAARAVAEAIEHDEPHDLDGLLRAALRRCSS